MFAARRPNSPVRIYALPNFRTYEFREFARKSARWTERLSILSPRTVHARVIAGAAATVNVNAGKPSPPPLSFPSPSFSSPAPLLQSRTILTVGVLPDYNVCRRLCKLPRGSAWFLSHTHARASGYTGIPMLNQYKQPVHTRARRCRELKQKSAISGESFEMNARGRGGAQIARGGDRVLPLSLPPVNPHLSSLASASIALFSFLSPRRLTARTPAMCVRYCFFRWYNNAVSRRLNRAPIELS
jgi:hypothetical protein